MYDYDESIEKINNLMKETLDEAVDLVHGTRAKDYGNVLINHAAIAQGWNVITKNAFETHGKITPAHVALMMDWVKSCRLLTTLDHKDSWVDKGGYTAIGSALSRVQDK